MPELPEVETVCRGLRKSILGDTITGAEVLRKDSIGAPSVKEFVKAVAGHRIEAVRRRGKYVLLDLSGGAGMSVHLRMSGRLLVVPAKAPPERFLRVRIKLASGRELRFEDMRVFGRIWFIPANSSFEDVIPTLGELGVEPFEDLDAEHLGRVLSGRKQAIKTALLDQRLVAGIGNIYADEALFHARIHPLRQAGTLRPKELEALANSIKNVLNNAIEKRGTTLRDYRDSEGLNGNYQLSSLVYGRFGEDCRICGSAIQRQKIGGRSSHFCLRCQPRRK